MSSEMEVGSISNHSVEPALLPLLSNHENDENDSSSPNTVVNQSTLNKEVTTTSTESSEVDVSMKPIETYHSIEQCRNSTSLMDDIGNDDVNCEVDMNTVKVPSNDIQPSDAEYSNTLLVEDTEHSQTQPVEGSIELHQDNDGKDKTYHEESELTSQDLSTLATSTSVAEVTESFLFPLSNHLRHSVATSVSTTQSRPPNWDNFVRSGARLKSLFVDAIGEVKNSFEAIHNNNILHSSLKRGREHEDDNESENNATGTTNQRSRVVTVADFSVELAREKTAQVLQLQRQLKDAQAQAAAVQAANASLREETSSSQSRLDRSVEALRIASNNAAKARADADAAEATAATLAQTLQNLQTVLTETKTASQILHQEQLQVNATVAAVESKLLQKEAEIIKTQKDLKSLRQANTVLENSNSQLLHERDELETKVRKCEQDLEEMKREKVELAAIEKARKDRADKVEQEWHNAQTLLVEATSGQASAKQTQELLEETIRSLQKTNEDLHSKLKDQQKLAREYKQRMTEALGKAEKEVQRLRISTEATTEELGRLKVEKTAADKQIQQLKTRLATTERSLKEYSAGPLSGTTPASSNMSPEAVTTPTFTTPNQLCFQLPPLSTSKKTSSLLAPPAITEKENIGVEHGDLCCVCFKPSLGVMKTCQCGAMTCHRKAHANCIKLFGFTPGPSVSHPGTPAPKLPVVLCDSVFTKIRASSSKEK